MQEKSSVRDDLLSWLCYQTHRLLVHRNGTSKYKLVDVDELSLKAGSNGWYHIPITREGSHTVFAVDGLVYTDSRDNIFQKLLRKWWVSAMRYLIKKRIVKVIF